MYARAMRWAVLLLAAAGCTPAETNEQAMQRAFGHGMYPTSSPPQRPPPRRVEPQPEPAPAVVPPAVAVAIATGEPPKPETPEERCKRTRNERVALAKAAILSIHERLEFVRPLTKWSDAHHCELKDTTGSVLVSRTKEAGGIRVATRYGHVDDLICDTTNIPEELTPEVFREALLYRDTDPKSNLFETYPECDSTEKPSLRVRFNDGPGQRAILAIP